MEHIIQPYISMLRDLIEDIETKATFDDELQEIREKFDENVEESTKRMSTNCLSSSQFLMDSFKDKLKKLSTDKMQECIKEIKSHIDWAIEQRNQIQINNDKQFVMDFLSSIDNFFQQDIKNLFCKINYFELVSTELEKSMSQRKITESFQQELKKNVETIKNLFKKEVLTLDDDLKEIDDNLLQKLKSLTKQIKSFEFNLNSEVAIKNRLSSSKLFVNLSENLNKQMNSLINEEKELNYQMKKNLEVILIEKCAIIIDKFNEFKNDYIALLHSNPEQKNEFNKEINSYDDTCKKQIKTLINQDWEKTTFNFNDLAIRLLNSKFDADIENDWFKWLNQIKNYDLIESLNFEIDHLDSRVNLDEHLEQILKQALKLSETVESKTQMTNKIEVKPIDIKESKLKATLKQKNY